MGKCFFLETWWFWEESNLLPENGRPVGFVSARVLGGFGWLGPVEWIFQTARLVNLQKMPCRNTCRVATCVFPWVVQEQVLREVKVQRKLAKNPIKVMYMDHPGSSHRSSWIIMANSVMAYDGIWLIYPFCLHRYQRWYHFPSFYEGTWPLVFVFTRHVLVQ